MCAHGLQLRHHCLIHSTKEEHLRCVVGRKAALVPTEGENRALQKLLSKPGWEAGVSRGFQGLSGVSRGFQSHLM